MYQDFVFVVDIGSKMGIEIGAIKNWWLTFAFHKVVIQIAPYLHVNHFIIDKSEVCTNCSLRIIHIGGCKDIMKRIFGMVRTKHQSIIILINGSLRIKFKFLAEDESYTAKNIVFLGGSFFCIGLHIRVDETNIVPRVSFYVACNTETNIHCIIK